MPRGVGSGKILGMRRALILLALLPAILLVQPAAADFVRHRDGNDTKGPLDIKWVTQGHHAGNLEHRVAFYEAVSMQVLSYSWIHIPINLTSDDPDPDEESSRLDAEIWMRSKGGHPYAEMWYVDPDFPQGVYPRVRALHPRPDLLIVRFPDHLLPLPGPYQWNANSRHPKGSDTCEGGLCFDVAAGRNVEDMRGFHHRD